MSDDLDNEAELRQKKICAKYEADFLSSPFDSIIGIALDTFDDLEAPINGLRHSIEREDNCSLYIWAGEYSQNDDFFKPVHVKHVLDIYPKALDYLGLAPGWRFLLKGNYEDVWYDNDLLLH